MEPDISKVRNQLHSKGALEPIKALLKKEVAETLLVEESTRRSKPQAYSLEKQALLSLLYNYLQLDENLSLTCSVFRSESSIETTGYFSFDDICKIFDVCGNSPMLKEKTLTERTTAEPFLCILLKEMSRINREIVPKTYETSTQTTSSKVQEDDPSVSARIALEQKLSNIYERHAFNRYQKCSILPETSLLESKMFAYQREVEQRERLKMEVTLAEFKRSFVARTQKDANYQCKMEVERIKQEEELRLSNCMKKSCEREKELMKEFKLKEQKSKLDFTMEINKLHREIDDLKRLEREHRSKHNIEVKKIQIEEQRLRNMLQTAQSKLDFASAKEEMIQKSLSEVHTATKRSCDNFTSNLKHQIEFCTKDFDKIKKLKDEAEYEERVEKLQVENMTLKSHLRKTKIELSELKCKVQAKDRELLLLQERYSQSTKEFAKKEEEVSSLRDDFVLEAKALKEARADLELINLKNSGLSDEILELRKLLSYSGKVLNGVSTITPEEVVTNRNEEFVSSVSSPEYLSEIDKEPRVLVRIPSSSNNNSKGSIPIEIFKTESRPCLQVQELLQQCDTSEGKGNIDSKNDSSFKATELSGNGKIDNNSCIQQNPSKIEVQHHNKVSVNSNDDQSDYDSYDSDFE